MQISPEMIDATTTQLKMVLEHADDIPPYVRDSGSKFVSDLDKWSEEEKAKAAAKIKGAA